MEESKKTNEIINKLFPKGDKRRGDAMVVAGISHMEGREEMRELIINHYSKKLKEEGKLFKEIKGEEDE